MDRQRTRARIDGLMAGLALLGSVVVASLIWTALAVFILPLPAATAGLFAAVGKAVEGRAGNPFADFLAGLRQRWRPATAIGGPALLLGLVLGVDALYLVRQPSTPLRAVGWLFASALLVWAVVMLVFWPALVWREASWQRLLKESFWLGIGNLPRLLAAVALAAALIAATLPYPFLIPFVPGAIALAASWLALRTFRRYGLVADPDRGAGSDAS